MTTIADLPPLITAERRAFGDLLAGLSRPDWDAASLCDGWRVREVDAHMTMPFRYSTARFLGELVRSRGDFARMADRVARRDAQAPVGTLLDGWRTNEAHPWKPPGGGHVGALTHDVVHGLDITVALGIDHPVGEQALRLALDHAAAPRTRQHVPVDLSGVRLEATDLEWAHGDGDPLRGRGRHLLLVLMDRQLPPGLVSGPAGGWSTSA